MPTGFVLEQITSAEFMRFHDAWGDNRVFRQSNGYFALTNPLTGSWPEEVLEQVAVLPCVVDIGVRIPRSRTWRHFAQEQLSDRDVVYDIAHMLSEDLRKRNYFEVTLCLPEVDAQDSAVLEFTEQRGVLVGYKLRIPAANRGLFTIPGAEYYSKINALAAPLSQARMLGALVKKPVLPDDQHTSRTG